MANSGWHYFRYIFPIDNKQLLDEVEQNIVICQWRADQLFADAKCALLFRSKL